MYNGKQCSVPDRNRKNLPSSSVHRNTPNVVPMFCSLIILFRHAFDAVAILVCLRSLKTTMMMTGDDTDDDDEPMGDKTQ